MSESSKFTVPDEAVEAAWKVYLASTVDGLDRVRSMLEAAAPHMLADAWTSGYASGSSNAMRRMSDEPCAPATPNPYATNEAAK